MKNHQWPIHALFGELVMGLHEIINAHDLDDEVAWDIAGVFEELFDAYVWRPRRNDQRSMHAMSRELVVGMCEIIDAHDLGDEVVRRLAEILDGLLYNDLVLRRRRQASVQELLDDLFAIYRGDYDEEQPSGRELLEDLLAMHLERRRKKRKPRRRGSHPAMVELLTRLDRFSTGHDDDAVDVASTSAN